MEYLNRILAQSNPYRYTDGIPPKPVILDEACASLGDSDTLTDENSKLTTFVQAKVRGVFGQMYMDIHQFMEGQRHQAAAVLGISPSTADRRWTYAHAWLGRKVSDTHCPSIDEAHTLASA